MLAFLHQTPGCPSGILTVVTATCQWRRGLCAGPLWLWAAVHSGRSSLIKPPLFLLPGAPLNMPWFSRMVGPCSQRPWRYLALGHPTPIGMPCWESAQLYSLRQPSWKLLCLPYPYNNHSVLSSPPPAPCSAKKNQACSFPPQAHSRRGLRQILLRGSYSVGEVCRSTQLADKGH